MHFDNVCIFNGSQKDVVKSSTTEIIDDKQVTTSMVARDVVDETRFDRITGPVPRSPTESPRKPSSSPERPGYPRGIPGLREDDKPKSLPAAGKPSRARQPDETSHHPGETTKRRRLVVNFANYILNS